MKAALVAVSLSTLMAISVSQPAAWSNRNLAIGARACQSSVLAGAYQDVAHLALAFNAIDGNPDPEYLHGSCSHTGADNPAWWRMELPKIYYITKVIVTARNSGAEWLNGAEILIGNSLEYKGNNNARCAIMSSVRPGSTVTYECGAMEGRYVNIVRRGAGSMIMLCEVEVYGYPADFC